GFFDGSAEPTGIGVGADVARRLLGQLTEDDCPALVAGHHHGELESRRVHGQTDSRVNSLWARARAASTWARSASTSSNRRSSRRRCTNPRRTCVPYKSPEKRSR